MSWICQDLLHTSSHNVERMFEAGHERMRGIFLHKVVESMEWSPEVWAQRH